MLKRTSHGVPVPQLPAVVFIELVQCQIIHHYHTLEVTDCQRGPKLSLVLPSVPSSHPQSQEEFQEAMKRQMEEQMRVYQQMQSQSKVFTEMQALQFQQMADRQRQVGEGWGGEG